MGKRSFLTKGKILAILVITLIGLIWYWATPKTQQEKDAKVDHQIQELENQLNTYKKKEQEEKLRKIQLQTMQNPQIALDAFKKVGFLIVYEGKISSGDTLAEGTFWGERKLNLDLQYNFGVGMDLTKVEVKQIVDTTIILKLPDFVLKYLEQDTENSKVESSTTWFAANFNPEDTDMALDNEWKETLNNIMNTPDIYAIAKKSGCEVIEELMKKVGYTEVKYN